MDALLQDVRYALRSFRKRPGFAATAIATLALGVGAAAAMFSVVRGIILEPLPYPDSEELVAVWTGTPEQAARLGGGMISDPDARDVGRLDAFESFAMVQATNLTVSTDGAAEQVPAGRVTPGFFDMFRAPLIDGREFIEAEDAFQGPAVAVISRRYWEERLGARENPLEATVRIAGRSHRIVGVAGGDFDYPEGAQIWVPVQNDDEGCGRGCVNRGAVARLAEDVSLEEARAELTALAARLEAQYPGSNTRSVFGVAKLRETLVGDVRPALWILFAAVVIVLLIACANVANLLLVRGQARLGEIAVRTTLGADARRVFRQLMTESALLALLGGMVGIILAVLGVSRILALAPEGIPRIDQVAIDPWTLAFAGALVLVTTLLFGLAPGMLTARRDVFGTLRAGRAADRTSERGGARGRSLILSAEVALSVVLLIGAGLMLRSLASLTDVDPGYELAGVAGFQLSLPEARYAAPADAVAFTERVLEQLEAAPEIDRAAVFIGTPLSFISMNGGFRRPELPRPDPGEGPSASYRVVSPGALEMLGIPIVAGRAFDDRDNAESEPVVIINQVAAERYFNGEDPIGRQMRLNISVGYDEEEPRRIVGVVRDFRGSRLTRAPQPEMMVPYAQAGASFPQFLIEGVATGAALRAAEREVRVLDAELPLRSAGPLIALAERQLAGPRFYLLLLSIFAALAVVLAAVGMYGVVAFAVSHRTREIGVRMAVGAASPQVIKLVLWQALRPALWGVGLGLLGAYWAGAAMQRLLYGVGPQDPITLIAVPAVLLLVVLVSCAVPARRATRIAPVTALRAE